MHTSTPHLSNMQHNPYIAEPHRLQIVHSLARMRMVSCDIIIHISALTELPITAGFVKTRSPYLYIVELYTHTSFRDIDSPYIYIVELYTHTTLWDITMAHNLIR